MLYKIEHYLVAVLCVGASSGIGRATAIHFAALGSRLALCDRDEPNLQVGYTLLN